MNAETREWRRTHTYGGFIWPPSPKPKRPRRTPRPIRPAGISYDRALEIAMAVQAKNGPSS